LIHVVSLPCNYVICGVLCKAYGKSFNICYTEAVELKEENKNLASRSRRDKIRIVMSWTKETGWSEKKEY